MPQPINATPVFLELVASAEPSDADSSLNKGRAPGSRPCGRSVDSTNGIVRELVDTKTNASSAYHEEADTASSGHAHPRHRAARLPAKERPCFRRTIPKSQNSDTNDELANIIPCNAGHATLTPGQLQQAAGARPYPHVRMPTQVVC